ncbi:lysophospholipid acyltransferase family protein [Bdellovibrio sp. HCB337]|uniref:lysophospholipid acyltransferase family protein n=1 Tax=Bdellovibrio sp. HCB337 TaxID=3394358 RepID=UPI0039A47A1C
MYRVLPRWIMELVRKYFRLQIEGIEHIPKRGPAIIAPNHSGYMGIDAVLLAHILSVNAKRIPRVLTHHFWFLTKTTALPAQKMGFTEATYKNGVDELLKKHAIVIFPEGEAGNFKPTQKMYELQEFRRGFVRMALETGSPIVPCIVIGAEESQINLSNLKLTKFLKGLVIPLPLNVIPLPVKWKIKFLEPIQLPYGPKAQKDMNLIREICDEIQEKMQKALHEELKKRKSIF